MLRSATLTTVPSSIAIPEPSTAAVSTQRPCGASPGRSGFGPRPERSDAGSAGCSASRSGAAARARAAVDGGPPAEVLVEPAGPVVLLQAPQPARSLRGGDPAQRGVDGSRGEPGPQRSGCTARCRSERSSYAAKRSSPPACAVADEHGRRRARRAPAPTGPARRRRGTGTGPAGTRGPARPGWRPVRGRAARTGRRWSPRGTCAPCSARAHPPTRPRPAAKVRLDCLFVRRHDGRVTSTASARVPQEERTRAMRARLMDATVELLVERGFGGTSTTLVSERAGCRRGAQLHHFPTKNDLVRRGGRAPHRGARRRAARPPRRGLPTRPAADPRRAGDARRPLHLARCSPRRSSCGSRPAPTRRCARPSYPWSSGSAGRPTG